MTEKKPYGKLIGASLGPGDPELITRRSWAVLQSGARWIYPVKKAVVASYALSIVERGGIPRPADAVELVFPMTRDPEILTKAWVRAAEQTVALLAEGRDLVFLVEGDASTFATFGHLARVARELGIAVETIQALNGELRGRSTPRGFSSYPLRLPKKAGAVLEARLSAIPAAPGRISPPACWPVPTVVSAVPITLWVGVIRGL